MDRRLHRGLHPLAGATLTRIDGTRRITYSNVVATLALFIALGGGALAAANIGRNDVGSREIAKNAVRAAEIKDGQVKGAEVDESSLGEVPSAGQLDGLDANSLIRTAFSSVPNVPDADGTALTTTITAPRSGFLTIVASLDVAYGASDDQLQCLLQVDESSLPNSLRDLNVNGNAGSESDSDCVTTITAPVAAGNRKVDFEVTGRNDAGFAAASLSVIFTPFNASGDG